MKIVIAGSRGIYKVKPDNSNLMEEQTRVYKLLLSAIKESGYDITEVISGTAAGVDRLGERWAMVNDIPIISMPADWNKYGKSAGPIRNQKMAELCDAAIILWDGTSPGTRNMIYEMNKLGKPTYIKIDI